MQQNIADKPATTDANSLRILYVEDSLADFALAERRLRKEGWDLHCLRVDTPEGLAEALDHGDWDLVLIDYNVPGMPFEASHEFIHARLPDIPVILVTGSVGEESVIEMMRMGAWDVVLKVNLARLPGSIRRCLREAGERARRRAVEADLKINEARLTLALAAAELGVWEWNMVTDETYWSPQCAAVLGGSVENRSFSEFLSWAHPGDSLAVQQRIAHSLSGRQPFEAELRLIGQDNQERCIICNGRPHYDEEGQPVRVVGVVQDITARRRAERERRQADAVFAHAQEGVLITDREGTILSANPAFCMLMGYEAEDVIGRNPRMFKSEQHDEEFYRTLFEETRQSGTWQGEIWSQREDGAVVPVWFSLAGVRDVNGTVSGYIATYSDISYIKRSESQLEFLSYHDSLTGLPNRTLLLSRLQSALARAQIENSGGAVLFLGLDRFKAINDGFGHRIGDNVLQAVAKRCRDRLREQDMLGRIGGDEFVVLLENIFQPDQVSAVAKGLIEALATPMSVDGADEIFLSCSIGICLFPDAEGANAERLLRNADSALILAKKQERGGIRFYTEQLITAATERVTLDSGLRRALERGEFVLHYQPLVETGSRRLIGVEALVRWSKPEQGLVPPNQFIPLAEETGLIVPLGAWVLETACRQFIEWRDQGGELAVMAVNLSPAQFRHPDLVRMVGDILTRTGMPPERLELEITEGALMDVVETEGKLHALKKLGVRLSIDDFGTGFSSLAYLKRFPIDKLKVDQSFVRDIPAQRADMEIVAAVISLAKNLRLDVLAEGVETEGQLEVLRGLECSYAQGYLFSRPVPADQISPLLKEKP
ncbi:MAG TPA: EAL domain-containing protein [Magnetospirillaceae bacterium]|nr:EAL domain-containing protein [Magnetospirillaceae bacterium]